MFAGIQHSAPPSAWGGEAWFAIRCHAANLLGDEELAAQLVDEYYLANHSIEREVELNIAIECQVAVADADAARLTRGRDLCCTTGACPNYFPRTRSGSG